LPSAPFGNHTATKRRRLVRFGGVCRLLSQDGSAHSGCSLTMYVPRTKDYSKRDSAKRWALPDRVFFACGACHILAFAFLESYGRPEMKALWIKPDAGHTGNHIFIGWNDRVFDYHGYSNRDRYLSHYTRRARQLYPGWGGSISELPPDVLISEPKSRAYDGLWLREPTQFLHDALPRARTFLSRFPPP
jgi:hypothetical protein